jgi:anti-anti-sigma factor
MFRCEKQKSRCRVHIDGEMTIYNAGALKDKLAGVLNDRRPIEIDLANVTEIDSAGIQLLILAKRERARAERDLTLVSHSDAVLDAFELMGLVGYFKDPVVLGREQGVVHGS